MMPRLHAETEDGQAVKIVLPQMQIWALGMLQVLIIAIVAFTGRTLLALRDQSTAMERTMQNVVDRVDHIEEQTDREVNDIRLNIVPRAEYNAQMLNIDGRLTRIEEGQDEILRLLRNR